MKPDSAGAATVTGEASLISENTTGPPIRAQQDDLSKAYFLPNPMLQSCSLPEP